MRILVTNDDSITAIGIKKLVEAAVKLGEVYVVAPDSQCSAMSQKLTINTRLYYKETDFPVEGVVKSYSIGGTPADCVRFAVSGLLDIRPDIVFSGINAGYNTGFDTIYSGTVGAAMEAVMKGIPAIAFSTHFAGPYDVVDKYLLSTAEELMNKLAPVGCVWNVNFPACTLSEFKGVLWDRIPAKESLYENVYTFDRGRDNERKGGSCIINGECVGVGAPGTDIEAVKNNYSSIGIIKNMVL